MEEYERYQETEDVKEIWDLYTEKFGSPFSVDVFNNALEVTEGNMEETFTLEWLLNDINENIISDLEADAENYFGQILWLPELKKLKGQEKMKHLVLFLEDFKKRILYTYPGINLLGPKSSKK